MLLKKIKKQKKLFSILILGSAVLGYGLASLLPEKFEGKVTIRSAYIGNLNASSNNTSQSLQVETNVQTIARLSLPKFYSDSILTACGIVRDNGSEVLAKMVQAIIVKSTNDLTALTYIGKSKEQTHACLMAIVERLTLVHEDIANGKKNHLLSLLAVQKTILFEMEKIEKNLSSAILKNGLLNQSPAESALALYGIQSKLNMIQEGRKSVLELESLLRPPFTQKLMPLESIYIAPKQNSRFLFVIEGLIFGFFVCATFCWREILSYIPADD